MNSINLSLSLLLLTGTALLAEPVAVDPSQVTSAPAVIPSKSTDQLAEALPILKEKYVDFAALQYKEGDRLADLIARSNGGVSLEASAPNPDEHHLMSALLPGSIVYYSLPTFSFPQGWTALLTELSQWKQQGATGIIFDVRSNRDPNDYSGVADMVSLVAPAKTSVLTMRGAENTQGSVENQSENATYLTNASAYAPNQVVPPFHGPIIVLINRQTTGAGEVLAAYLKQYCGALIIGQTTQGREAAFGWKQLPSGKVIRFAVAHALLPDGTDLWNHPVVPDLNLPVNEQSEKGALILITHHEILDVIGESPDRHLMSEAALIKGEDPEWDSYLASLEKKPVLLTLPIIHDETLISALDSLKAIQVSQRRTETSTTADTASSTTTTVQ
jgi:hypothetical protein